MLNYITYLENKGVIKLEEKVFTEVKNVIENPEEKEKLWIVYDEAFSTALEEAPHEQRNYTETTFKEALEDPDFVKFVTYKNEEIIGIGLATTNLSKAPWVSPEFYRRKFPDWFAKKKILYVTVIGIRHEYLNKGYGANLIARIIKYVDEIQGMVCYDFSENKRMFLPQMIQAIGKKLGYSIEGGRLDCEMYYYQQFA